MMTDHFPCWTGQGQPGGWQAGNTFQSHPSGEAGMLSSHPEKYVTSLGTAPATLPGFGLTSLGPQREKSEAEKKRRQVG